MKRRILHHKFLISIVLCVGALIGLRLGLAWIVKGVINRQLAQMSGYSGRVEGIGLSLWRGAYQIEGMQIVKKAGRVSVPFFRAPVIDIGLQWKALFRRRIVASVAIFSGELNFVNGPAADQRQSGRGEDWKKVLTRLVPITINQFRLHDSAIHFRDPYGQPPVDVQVDRVTLRAEDLSSRGQGDDARLGTVEAEARAMRVGQLSLQSRFNPFASVPTFDYNVTLRRFDLTDLNPLLMRYLGVDVHRGTIDLFSEGAAAEGRFKGYLKPMVTKLKVMKPHEHLELVPWLKKALVGVIGWIFKNERQEVATKFEFAGTYRNPKTSLWDAAMELIRNAFVEALPASLEGSIKVEDLQHKPNPTRK